MNPLRFSLAILLPVVLATSLITGCATNDGYTGPTMGQELTDLDQAYDNGALSKREFKKAKKRILKSDRYDRGLF